MIAAASTPAGTTLYREAVAVQAARAPSREALSVLPAAYEARAPSRATVQPTACDTVAASAPSREVKLQGERGVLPAASEAVASQIREDDVEGERDRGSWELISFLLCSDHQGRARVVSYFPLRQSMSVILIC